MSCREQSRMTNHAVMLSNRIHKQNNMFYELLFIMWVGIIHLYKMNCIIRGLRGIKWYTRYNTAIESRTIISVRLFFSRTLVHFPIQTLQDILYYTIQELKFIFLNKIIICLIISRYFRLVVTRNKLDFR